MVEAAELGGLHSWIIIYAFLPKYPPGRGPFEPNLSTYGATRSRMICLWHLAT